MRIPAPGERFLNRLQILEKLGEGGFAVVFKAHDGVRELALKIIRPDRDGYDRDILARFKREVSILSQLRDPHTVELYDWGESPSGLLYCVFEFVPGEDLSKYLKRNGIMRPEEVGEMLRQCLASLREAHDLGLLHRDIKPDNIRLFADPSGALRVKLLDFGIAKPTAPDGRDSITKTGELVGTPRYMSPEQLVGDPLKPSSDLYSLGLVALEAAEGRHVLPGDGISDQLQRIVPQWAFSTPQLNQSAPHLSALLERMTLRQPAQRYHRAVDVLAALDDRSPTLRQSARRPPVERTSSMEVSNERTDPSVTMDTPERANLSLLFVAVGAVALVSALAVISLYFLSNDEPPPPVTPPPKAQPTPPAVTRVDPTTVVALPVEATPDLGPKVPRPENGGVGCGEAPPFEGFGKLRASSMFGGPSVNVYVPKDYDRNRAYPVVMLFHQDVRSGGSIINQTEFDRIADREGAILVAPDGGAMLVWRNASDVANMHGLMTVVDESLCIDRRRIFAVGHGVGGFAANYLSCELWVAGIATTSFRLRADTHVCDPARAIPNFMIAPMNSRRIPPEGGGVQGCNTDAKISLKRAEELWRERNRCTEKRSTYTKEKDGDICYEWECEAELVSCHIQGGHSWPGSRETELDLMGCDTQAGLMDFPATETIWKFFVDLPPNEDAFTPSW